MATPLLTVNNLGFKFENASPWAFREVSFELFPMERLVIIGPSGAGKTTLLKCLCGLHLPTEGAVHSTAKHVGMLFQRNALFDSMTALDNLVFTLQENAPLGLETSRAKALEKLALVGLEGAEDKFPHELSGGMQKRLGIARAWIAEPELLFYDEPTAGLDPITSKKIAELLEERNTATILVTNDVFRARQLGTRVLYLDRERGILDAGPGAELFSTQDPRVRAFVLGSET